MLIYDIWIRISSVICDDDVRYDNQGFPLFQTRLQLLQLVPSWSAAGGVGLRWRRDD